jgi:hypothetical protein
MNYESPPERVHIQVVRVRKEGFCPDVLQASLSEMPDKIATDEVIIDRFPEDAVEWSCYRNSLSG